MTPKCLLSRNDGGHHLSSYTFPRGTAVWDMCIYLEARILAQRTARDLAAFDDNLAVGT